jgi:hypothetical protein
VDIRIEGTTIVVTFSRRNLQALLHRLDYFKDNNYTLFKHVGKWTVRVHAESDERHYTQRPLNRAPDPMVESSLESKVRKFPPLEPGHWLFDGKTQCPVCHQIFKPGDEVAMSMLARADRPNTNEAAIMHWQCVPPEARDSGAVQLKDDRTVDDSSPEEA